MRAPLRLAAACALALAGLATPARAACTAAKPDPFGTERCEGVRPGVQIVSGTELCSLGFLFEGSDRRRYAATSAHCAFDPDPARDPGRTQTWAKNGPAVTDADGMRIGRFAYASYVGQFRDFALIRLDSGVRSDPAVCHFGGPTGLNTDVANDDLQVHHYGRGVGVGDYVPARTGDMFYGLYRADYVYFYGAASEGDSGSPVLDPDGRAIGLVTALASGTTGNVGVVRLADNVKAAEKALRIRLTLLTAPAA